MAINRAAQSSVQSGLPKFDSIWDGRSAVGSMEAISSITLSAAQASIEFNNIPSTYTHLQIRGFAQTNRGTYATDSYYIRFNGDITANYNWGYLRGTGAAAASYHYSSAQTSIYCEMASGSTVSPAPFGVAIIDILDYANINKYKTTRTLSGTDINGTVGGYGGYVYYESGLWMSTSAITSIKITGDNTFQANTSFSLYGIK